MAKISLSIEDIKAIVTKLNKSCEEIETTWNSVKNEDIKELQSSWTGDDCTAYISKINDMDTKVKNAIQAQKLLAAAYDNAAKLAESTQSDVAAAASKL